MHIKPFQAVYPNLDYVTSPDSFFNSVREEYPEYAGNGFFTKTAQEAIFIYRIKTPERHYTGLVACTDIRDYLEGHIKEHEHTLPAKEQQQIQLMLRRKAAIKPVLLAYKRVEAISNWIEAYIIRRSPFFEVETEEAGEHHFLWEVRDGQAIRDIQSLFEQYVPWSYIADGHHRTSTTALLHGRPMMGKQKSDFSLLLCALFPSSDIDILDFNRVVYGLNGLSKTAFMAHISRYFEIGFLDEPGKPSEKHQLTMYFNREWYSLRWKENILDQYAGEEVVLDAMLLDDCVLANVLGVEDVRTDQRILYVEGPRGVEGILQAVSKGEEGVAFCLFPVKLEELMRVADAGKAMPPKSTWIEPRMKNGLLVREY
ncbi:MAG: DUF1015 domain-containing protein [Lewinellaceae bacterium]|nr:DUF1015 domain-containing protein [Lewinellaceae bacterium]